MQLFYCHSWLNIIFYTMSRNHQRIIQIHSLLSKLLDSLCFQLAITIPDQNSLSLLEILMWRRNDEVSQQQLKQLYSGWLQARNVFDLFKAKQIQPFSKAQLITIQITQQNFMNVSQVTKSLEIINMLYNQLYLEKRPDEKNSLDHVEAIFEYLDYEGLIHLRLSSLFYFCGVVLICQGHTVPHSYDIFKVHLNEFRKQMCEIQGMVSLRCFKNFLFTYSQRNLLFKNFLDVCQDINKYTHKGKKNQPINILQQALQKWKLFPRFSNGQLKNRVQKYRRLFEQNQFIFFDKDPNQALDHFKHKYGQQFIKSYDIDTNLIRQFMTVIKDLLNHYIEIFRKVSEGQNKSTQPIYENSKQTPRYKTVNYQIQQGQNIKFNKKNSQKQKTPVKQHVRRENEFRNRTPKHQRQVIQLQRQFGSAQRIHVPQNSARQYTPTKSTQTASYQRNVSSTFTGSKINKPKFLPQTVTMHYQTSYFKNKRVESYETVMNRLKKK